MTKVSAMLVRAVLAPALAVTAFAAPAVANADPDSDFSNALHTVGIYGPKDYNAWIAKIACRRLDRGVDNTAFDSAEFVAAQLKEDSTTEHAWQFLGLAFPTYCPQHQVLLQQAAEHPA